MARSVEGWTRARVPVVIALITAIVGLAAIVGADARWLAALGHAIMHAHSVPDGIPFASAPTGSWPNTLVLAELIFDGLERTLGDRGLVLAQLIMVAGALSVLARDARAAGASAVGISSALATVAVGAFPSLAVCRVQMFSLVLFPTLVLLLRAQTRGPSARIWLAIPLLALWSNLHGAALSGLALLYAYLLLERVRHDRITALAVALAAPVALCLTPAGIRTINYYAGLLTNVAAERGVGQWAPLGASAADVPLVLAALALAVRMRRSRPRPWELAVLVGFAALTIRASRDGVWLLFLMAGPAAHSTRMRRSWAALLPIGAALAAALLAFDIAHWSNRTGGRDGVVQRAIALADGTPILADSVLAEQVALDGGRIWAGNPLDAFSRPVQGIYLDWLNGSRKGRRALDLPQVDVVVVENRTADQRLTRSDADFAVAASFPGTTIYVRRSQRG